MSTLFQNFFKIFFSFCFYSDYLKNLISFKDQNNKLVYAVFYFNCDFLLLIYILYFMCFHLLFNTWNIIPYCSNKVNAFFVVFLIFLSNYFFLFCSVIILTYFNAKINHFDTANFFQDFILYLHQFYTYFFQLYLH